MIRTFLLALGLSICSLRALFLNYKIHQLRKRNQVLRDKLTSLDGYGKQYPLRLKAYMEVGRKEFDV